MYDNIFQYLGEYIPFVPHIHAYKHHHAHKEIKTMMSHLYLDVTSEHMGHF